MGFEVISIEIVEDLVKMAEINLSKLNMQSASFHIQDGKSGFPSRMPYAGILAAASRHNCPTRGWTNLVKVEFSSLLCNRIRVSFL